MSHRTDQKQAARAERLRREEQARHQQRQQRLRRRAGIGVVGVIAAILVAVGVLGGGSGESAGTASTDAMGATASTGGPAIGTMAPGFALTDVVSGKQVTLRSLLGHKTLLFFSEGVGCQACMVQAADLQNNKTLTHAGIKLVSITTDPPTALAQAASQYGIRTPMLADPSTSMSGTYGMLAHGGMQHQGEDGHAFMLLDPNGTVLWHQAYSQMYVNPSQLLSDMGSKA
jgi:peroxiredoxin Q/BCP